MRTGDSVANAIGRTARYGKLARRERHAISQRSTLVAVPAGAVLAREGRPGRQFVIVLTGAATVRAGGREQSALLAGDHFGELALLDDGISPATVVAETAMTLAVVAAAEFGAVLDASPSVARAVLGTVARRLRTAA